MPKNKRGKSTAQQDKDSSDPQLTKKKKLLEEEELDQPQKEEHDQEVVDKEDDEEEDDEAVLLTPAIEDTFLKLLPMIGSKDSQLYDPKKTFFPQEIQKLPKKVSESKEEEKPLFLHDYQTQSILEKEGDLLSESEEEEEEVAKPEDLSYVQEQSKLKQELLDMVKDFESKQKDTNLLVMRKKSEEELQKDKEESETLNRLMNQMIKNGEASGMKTVADFWKQEELDPNEKFLRSYILREGWKDKTKSDAPTYEEIVKDDSLEKDEEELWKQADYEADYNLRGVRTQTSLMTFPRTLKSMRLNKKQVAARLKRLQRKERKESEKEQKMQELKRISKTKRTEIIDKIKTIRDISGIQDHPALSSINLDDDYDPEKFDKDMSNIFNDNYFEGNDEEYPLEEGEYDQLLNMDEEAIGDENLQAEDVDQEEDEFAVNIVEEENEEGGAENEESDQYNNQIGQLVDDYFQLDYEDLIAGEIPCRFKYVEVEKNNFGVDIEDLLNLDESVVNKYIPLKAVATYNQKHHLLSRDQLAEFKKVIHEVKKNQKQVEVDPSLNPYKKKILKKKKQRPSKSSK